MHPSWYVKENLPFSFPVYFFSFHLLDLAFVKVRREGGPGVVMHSYNLSAAQVVGVRSLGSALASKCVQSPPGLHKSVSLNTQTNIGKIATTLWGKK